MPLSVLTHAAFMDTVPSPETATAPRGRARRLRPSLIVGALIFAAFAAFVQWYLGWPALMAPWARLPLAATGTAAALMAASYGVRALRLYDYFSSMHGRFPLALKLTLQHNAWNNLLPMRSGEASFPILMARYFGTPAAESLPALLWFRVLDAHTLAAAALGALGGLWLNRGAAAALFVIWMSLPWLLYRLGGRHAVLLDARPVHGRWLRTWRRLLAGLPLARGAFWRAWAWTGINWVVKFAALVWLLRQFQPMPLAAAILGVAAGDATSVLPIHGVAGLGTYEAGIVAGLAASGVSPGATAALKGAIDLHLFVLSAAVLGGALSFFIPAGRRRG